MNYELLEEEESLELNWPQCVDYAARDSAMYTELIHIRDEIAKSKTAEKALTADEYYADQLDYTPDYDALEEY